MNIYCGISLTLFLEGEKGREREGGREGGRGGEGERERRGKRMGSTH